MVDFDTLDLLIDDVNRLSAGIVDGIGDANVSIEKLEAIVDRDPPGASGEIYQIDGIQRLEKDVVVPSNKLGNRTYFHVFPFELDDHFELGARRAPDETEIKNLFTWLWYVRRDVEFEIAAELGDDWAHSKTTYYFDPRQGLAGFIIEFKPAKSDGQTNN